MINKNEGGSDMERVAVQSRDIAIVGYDPETQALEIAFRNGGVYRYSGVPAGVHESLMSAASHGTYFNQNIKDRYPCTKLA